MLGGKSMIVLLLYAGILSTFSTAPWKKSYFNRRLWFTEGNIYHIEQADFWHVFQQHRNVNRHIDWLSSEIASLNRQITSVKQQLAFITFTRHEQVTSDQDTTKEKNTSTAVSSNQSKQNVSASFSQSVNHRNIRVLRLLSQEPLLEGYLSDLSQIYRFSTLRTIECVAIVIDQNSLDKYLFIKIDSGEMDTYQMNETKSLNDSYWNMTEPLSSWNSAEKQLEFYRRFIQNNSTSEMMVTDQLVEMKNRAKLNDLHFFDMMGQILRIKYHVDPSSLSCILEAFFGNIYSCDGRLIHPHELKLLSDDNDRFVFYAITMETKTEKQIYPLGTNNHIRQGDQIYFLYTNHPKFNALSSMTCTDCVQHEQTFIVNNDQESAEVIVEEQPVEPSPVIDVETERPVINSQNYIVYVIVTSILVYIFYSIYLSRQQQSFGCQGRKQSVTSRRGR